LERLEAGVEKAKAAGKPVPKITEIFGGSPERVTGNV
jgi:hypothetical protein